MDEKEAKKHCHCLRTGSDQKTCRQHIDYPDEHNCALVTVEVNGEMSLRKVAARMGLSHIRIRQIEQEALKKLKKIVD